MGMLNIYVLLMVGCSPTPKKKYDSNGKVIETSYYNSDGMFEKKTFSKYGFNGNWVGTSSLDSGGKLVKESEMFYKYDTKNRIITERYNYYESKFGELQQIPVRKTTYEYVDY